VFEELGDGFALLAFDAPDSAVESFEGAARALSVPLVTLRDSLAGGRERYGARLILVRPDQFVAWAGDAGLIACGFAKSVLANRHSTGITSTYRCPAKGDKSQWQQPAKSKPSR